MRDNKRLALDPKTTDEDILKRIRDCERDASSAHGFWEMGL
jgi:hypothetical protein